MNNKNKPSEKDLEILKAHVERSLKGIGECYIFSGIVTGNYLKDPVCLIQLSLGLLLDKPLFLLIDDTLVPPLKLLKVCEGYEMYTKDDIQSSEQATKRLLKSIEQYITKQKEKKGG